jgi:hypothetical protein
LDMPRPVLIHTQFRLATSSSVCGCVLELAAVPPESAAAAAHLAIREPAAAADLEAAAALARASIIKLRPLLVLSSICRLALEASGPLEASEASPATTAQRQPKPKRRELRRQ